MLHLNDSLTHSLADLYCRTARDLAIEIAERKSSHADIAEMYLGARIRATDLLLREYRNMTEMAARGHLAVQGWSIENFRYACFAMAVDAVNHQ